MRTVAIIQARIGSSRLPSKVLLRLGGKPVLQHVIERALAMKTVDEVVCTFPREYSSESLVTIAKFCKVRYFLGPENNVLERFYLAAAESNADTIVRITADCPLFDPGVGDKVVSLRKSEAAEYASNVWPRSFPKGLDCEAFTMRALSKAYSCATEEYDLEHVTPYIVRNNDRVNLPSGRFDLARLRLVIDTMDDYRFLKKLFEFEFKTTEDIVKILKSNPDLKHELTA